MNQAQTWNIPFDRIATGSASSIRNHFSNSSQACRVICIEPDAALSDSGRNLWAHNGNRPDEKPRRHASRLCSDEIVGGDDFHAVPDFSPAARCQKNPRKPDLAKFRTRSIIENARNRNVSKIVLTFMKSTSLWVSVVVLLLAQFVRAANAPSDAKQFWPQWRGPLLCPTPTRRWNGAKPRT